MAFKSKSFNTVFTSILILITFICAQFAAFGCFNARDVASFSADNTQVSVPFIDMTSNITNSNFTSTSSSTFPKTPSSWSVIDNLKAPEAKGIIDISNAAFQKNYSAYKIKPNEKPVIREGASEQSMLMINNGENSRISYGYSSNSTLTLLANSFYSVKLYVLTSTNAHASVYLNSEDFSDTTQSQFTKINTNNGWQEINFLIATPSTKNITVNIELYLGSKTIGSESSEGSIGYVLFDDITLTRHSGDNFDSVIESSPRHSLIDLRPTLITSGDGFVKNGDFATTLQDSFNMEVGVNANANYVQNFNNSISVNGETLTLGTNQRGNLSGVIVSAKNGYGAIASADITIKKQQIYKISFWAKGNVSSGSLNISLGGDKPNVIESDEKETLSQSFTTLATDAINIYNYWAQYDFYVTGHPLVDSIVNLKLGIGAKDSNATGYVAVTGITSELISSQQLTDSQAANMNYKSLDMFASGSLLFNNSSFNSVSLTDSDLNYPLVPNNWTKSNTDDTRSGVINLSSDSWNLDISRPIKEYDVSDNILMIRTASAQSFTSETTAFAGDGYAKVTFEVYTRDLSGNEFAYVNLTNDNDVLLAQFKIKSTNLAWKTYTLYIHNYLFSQNVKATLGLGTEQVKADGIAFFDNIEFDSTLTADSFNAASNDTYVQVIDLAKNSFDATVDGSNMPTLWDYTDSISASFGIMDYRGNNDIDSPGKPENAGNNLLYIHSEEPTYFTYSSKLDYVFEASKYYKISVFVKTVGIPEDEEGAFDDSGNKIINGAFFKISGLDQSFSGIKTGNSFSNKENEWKEYIIYFQPTEATTSKIELGLGGETMQTKGFVFFSNLSVTSLEEDEYTSATATLDKDNLPNNILLATTPVDDEEQTNNGSAFDNFQWYAVPTIIIAIAVIVAIFGFFINKIQKSRKEQTKVSTNYDRLQTLLKDVDRRERKSSITHKLNLLKEELKQSNKFLSEELAELDRQQATYDTAREIAKDNPDVKLEMPNVVQLGNSIQIQEKKIEQIEIDIEILEDELERIKEQQRQAIEKSNKSTMKTIKKLKK